MWPDIENAPLDDNRPENVQKLPRMMERLEASWFFAGYTPEEWGEVEIDEKEKVQIKSWLAWAAIVALPAAIEALYRDLEQTGLGEKWLQSQEKRDLYTDPLLAVLFELRNYGVHVELKSGEIRLFQAVLGHGGQLRATGKEKRNLGERFYLAHLEYDDLAELRNIKTGKSKVTREMIEWFNRQASTWPAEFLLSEARQRYSRYVSSFLQRHVVK